MKSGKCPKCGSEEVYAGDTLPLWTKQGSYYANSIPISGWRYAEMDNYVCASCGYIESYIGDPRKLRLIQQKWPRVRERDSFEPLGGRKVVSARQCPNCGSSLNQGWKACPHCGQQLV